MPHGLAVEGQPSLDEWLEAGALLNKAADSVHWWIGDWLNYGMEHYALTYEKATELLKQRRLNFSYGTLRNDKYVAIQIPLSRRRDKLDWSLHQEVAPLPPQQQEYWLGYAEEHNLKRSELREAIKGAGAFPWLRYTDVWNFSECDDRFGIDYDGRIPGQIIQNLLYYYTDASAFIIDPMAGGGTTLDVCTKCDKVRRRCLAFDIKPSRPDILLADAAKPWSVNGAAADLIFIDPPYWSQMENSYGGIASQPLNEYLSFMRLVLDEVNKHLKSNGILALLIAPMAIKTGYLDLPFMLCGLAQQLGFELKRRIQVPVGSQQIGPAVTRHCKDTRTMMAIARDLLILQKMSQNDEPLLGGTA